MRQPAINLLTCNDNYNGFLSRISLQVQEGEKYYFEIVDRDLAASDAKILNLEVWIETRTNWRTDSAWNTTAAQRSRHMTATVGDYIYVAGGRKPSIITSTGWRKTVPAHRPFESFPCANPDMGRTGSHAARMRTAFKRRRRRLFQYRHGLYQRQALHTQRIRR